MSKLSRRHRRSLMLSALLVAAVLSTACQTQEPMPIETPAETPVETPESPDGSSFYATISSPSGFMAMYRNPLEILTKDHQSDKMYTVSTSIAGLKNEALEKEINGKLQEKHEALLRADYPPYRGIKTLALGDAVPTSQTVSTMMVFNNSGLLSLTFTRDWEVKGNYIEKMDTMTLDLDTGREVTLKDLFADDVDYLKLLSDWMASYFTRENSMEDTSYFALVEPFPGIQKDQKFFLNENSLVLVFDEHTPFLDLRFYPLRVYIPMEMLRDSLVLDTRFGNKNLDSFKASPTEYLVLSRGTQNLQGKSIHETRGRIFIFSQTSMPKETPQSLQDLVTARSALDEELLAAMTASNEEGGLYQECSLSRYSLYYSLTHMLHVTRPKDYELRFTYSLYDLQGKELTIKDLFVPGFDYEPAVLSKIEKELQAWPNFTGDPQKAAKEYYDQGMTYGLTLYGITAATVPLDLEAGQKTALTLVIPFEDFGIENLVLFQNLKEK